MRECIYCGRSLEKGEKCSCAMSVRVRMEKERANAAEKQEADKKNTGKDKAKERKAERERKRAEKEHIRAERRKNRSRTEFNVSSKNVFVNIGRNLLNFFKAPIDAVANPRGMGKAEIFVLAAFEGVIIGLCILSVMTGMSRGALSLIGNLIGFNGIAGYNYIYMWLMYALMGAVGNVILFMLYSLIFFAIGKWIFRQFATFWDYAKRLIFAALPFTLVGALGTLLGIFSQLTFLIWILCGLAGNVAVTYEILRSMWSSKSASRVLYTMMLGLFVFLNVIIYIVGLSIL